MTTTLSRRILTTTVALGAVATLGVSTAGSALAADPVGASSAQAVNIDLLNTLTVASPLTAATNTGGATVTNVGNDALTVLGGQSLLTGGVLATSATAQNDGLSYSCAGVVQPGGSVSVGTDGTSCTSTGTGAGGVTLDLSALAGITLPLGIGSLSLQLNSVTAYAANNAGTTSGGAAVTGGSLSICLAVVLGACTLPISVPLNIAGGVNANLLPVILNAITGTPALAGIANALSNGLQGVVSLRTNVQDVDPATNAFRVTALRATVLSGNVGTVNLAVATAGPNAVPTPMVSGLGWPIGLGLILLVGMVVVAVRRQRAGAPEPVSVA